MLCLGIFKVVQLSLSVDALKIMGGLAIGSIALSVQGNGAYGKSAHNFKS